MTQESVTLEEVSRFTDQQLIARLQGLARDDQSLGARLLVHLGEVDARGLYREYACSSMFAYCVEELHMSEAEGYLRIQAARLGRQFPLVVVLFEQGALHLSTIKLLAPHLTPDNHVQVLERARGKRKREIELLVAELAPKPDVPSRMRKLPERSRAPASQARASVALPLDAQAARSVLDTSIAALPVLANQASQWPFVLEGFIAAPPIAASEASFALEAPRRQVSSPLVATPKRSSLDASINAPPAAAGLSAAPTNGALEAPFALEAPRSRGSCVPLSPGRYKVEFTAGQGLHDKLEQLQALLRHRVPDGDLAVIVELAVDLFFDKTMKQRFAQSQAPKKPRVSQRGDHAKTQAPKKPRALQRGDDAQPQAPEPHREIQREHDAHPQTPEQHREIQRGDERARDAARVSPLAANASGSPGARPRQVNSRYIPRAVAREVYARDGGRCTFVSSDGKRCSDRGFLELHHHDVPYGKGGKATVDNVRLACRAHNALYAERDYGTRVIRLRQRRGVLEHENRVASSGT